MHARTRTHRRNRKSRYSKRNVVVVVVFVVLAFCACFIYLFHCCKKVSSTKKNIVAVVLDGYSNNFSNSSETDDYETGNRGPI